MYQCESWTIKKAERPRIDAFELWCWRRLWRVLWTARRSNQSILKEINPECSLEGLMLKLKLQYFGHLMQSQLIGKDPDAGKEWGQEKKGVTEDEMVGRHHWLHGHELEQTEGDSEGQGSLACCSPLGRKELDTMEWLNNNSVIGSDGAGQPCWRGWYTCDHWCVKNLPTFSGVKHQFTLLADSVGQEFREDAVGMAVSAARCLGLSWGVLKLDMPWWGLESSGDFSADVLWLKLVVSQNTSGQLLGVVCPHRVVWASSQHSVWIPGEQDAGLQSALRRHFHPALPIKAVTEVTQCSQGGDLVKGLQEEEEATHRRSSSLQTKRGGQRQWPGPGTSWVSLGIGHCTWRIWKKGESLEIRSGGSWARSCQVLQALEGS